MRNDQSKKTLSTPSESQAQLAEASQEQIGDSSEIKTGNALKEFLIQKSSEDIRFAHLMFWCILSSMDDT